MVLVLELVLVDSSLTRIFDGFPDIAGVFIADMAIKIIAFERCLKKNREGIMV